jgi:hypothetical protein
LDPTSAEPNRASSHRSPAAENIRPASHSELSQKITTLPNLTAPALRDEWRRLYRGLPPRLSRDLLVRAIAYRLQELAYGGLSKATQRKLVALTKELETNGSIVCNRDRDIRPGARLVREWRGKTHTVVVTEDGFEHAGKTYSSLSKIAQAITGAHWSGPRFFGLKPTEPTGSHTDPLIVLHEAEDSDG